MNNVYHSWTLTELDGALSALKTPNKTRAAQQFSDEEKIFSTEFAEDVSIFLQNVIEKEASEHMVDPEMLGVNLSISIVMIPDTDNMLEVEFKFWSGKMPGSVSFAIKIVREGSGKFYVLGNDEYEGL